MPRCKIRCVLVAVMAIAAIMFTLPIAAEEPEVFTAVFPGVGHTYGQQGSLWLADVTLQAQECGDNPWGIPGSCWWEPEALYYKKSGDFQFTRLDSEWWDTISGVPSMQWHEDIIGEQGWGNSGCLVIQAHVPFFAVARSYNAADPKGDYGYLLEPARPLDHNTTFQWPIHVEGRGNCFTFLDEFEAPLLTVTRGEEETEIYIAPGCRLLDFDFQFGDLLTLTGFGDVTFGCSAMANGTSDGVRVKLIEVP